MLTGCVAADADSRRARALGDDWRMIDAAAATRCICTATGAGAAVAARRGHPAPAWRADYRDLQNGLPRTMRITSIERATRRVASI